MRLPHIVSVTPLKYLVPVTVIERVSERKKRFCLRLVERFALFLEVQLGEVFD